MTDTALELIRRRLKRARPRRINDPAGIEAAVAIVLVPAGDARPEVLLIKRAERAGDPWSGQMALPGGRRDSCDEDLLQTARRETLEETGIRLENDQLLGELDDLHPRTRVLPPIVVRPFVFGLRQRPPVIRNDEVTLHLWVPLDRLKQSAGQSIVKVRGQELDVNSYVLGPHVVWGMTERIIRPIIDLTG